MAITLIVGNPGAGKSYSAVHLCILPAIRKGRPVFTNIPLKLDLIYDEFDLLEDQYIQNVTSDEIEKDPDIWMKIPGGCLIVIDECWRFWDSGKKASKQANEFFREHRHRVGTVGTQNISQDIVILTQATADVARFIKSNVHETFIVNKLDDLGAAKRFRLSRYNGAVSSDRPVKAKFIADAFGKYSADVYRYYQSHTKKDESAADAVDLSTVELGSNKKVTAFHSAKFKSYVVVMIFCFGFLWYQITHAPPGSMFGPEVQASVPEPPAPAPVSTTSPSAVSVSAPEIAPAPARADSGAAPMSPPAPAPAVAPEPVSDRFWINGTARAGDDFWITLTDSVVTRRVRVAAADCALDGFFVCRVAGVRYSDVPLQMDRTLVPRRVRQVSDSVQESVPDSS